MTLRTVQIEIIGSVIGIDSRVIIRFVAGETVACRAGVSVGMTINALQGNMRPGQGELSLVVIKCNLPPCRFIVTIHTICRE